MKGTRILISPLGDGVIAVRPSRLDVRVVARMATVAGRRWDPSARCWRVPGGAGALSRLLAALEGEAVEVDPALREGALPHPREEGPLADMRRELLARRYSPKTSKAYLRTCGELLRFAGKAADEAGPEDVRRYLAHLAEDRGASASTINQAVSALRFLFGRVLGKSLPYEARRPRKDRRLPVVLGRDEVARLLSAVANPKHRAALALAYSAGLRVGEVVRLRAGDVDRERGLLLVRGGKGRKDRCTLLSAAALACLDRHLADGAGWAGGAGGARGADRAGGGRPRDGWLFPGAGGRGHLSERSVQHVFERARGRAGIAKGATVHSLRHSFATHLMEEGVGLRYIQELLGHASSRTTEVYTHVATRDLARISSPLDRFAGETATWTVGAPPGMGLGEGRADRRGPWPAVGSGAGQGGPQEIGWERKWVRGREPVELGAGRAKRRRGLYLGSALGSWRKD